MPPPYSSPNRCILEIVALALLTSCILSVLASQPPDKKAPPKPLPKEIIEAWKKGGAEVGFMRVNSLAFYGFVSEKEGAAGDLPAFDLFDVKEGQLAKLPAPPSVFGLTIHMPQETDAPLKELAGLKNLHALVLYGHWMTDAGLKELAGLNNLQALALGATKVTDAGLKELAGLK